MEKNNIFFKKKNIPIKNLFPKIKFKNNLVIKDIKPLYKAKKNELTFFDSIKYKDIANKTKAAICLTNKKLAKYLPHTTEKVVVDNVLFELAKVLKLIYPDSDVDFDDNSLNPAKNILKMLVLVIMF